jgi:hypothetical protein
MHLFNLFLLIIKTIVSIEKKIKIKMNVSSFLVIAIAFLNISYIQANTPVVLWHGMGNTYKLLIYNYKTIHKYS